MKHEFFILNTRTALVIWFAVVTQKETRSQNQRHRNDRFARARVTGKPAAGVEAKAEPREERKISQARNEECPSDEGREKFAGISPGRQERGGDWRRQRHRPRHRALFRLKRRAGFRA